MSELVSVIIPTLNRANTIVKAIRSVLEQTYNNIELIIVDDGSTDNTEEIVNNFNDPRIIYIKHPFNKGGAAAKNTGIKCARGNYIAFQDSDDEWLLEKLEKQMLIIEKSKGYYDFIFCSGFVKSNDKKIVIGRAPWINNASKEYIIREIFSYSFISLQGIIVSKNKIVDSGGFDPSFFSGVDYELFLRLLPLCNIYFLDEPLFIIYFSQECVTKRIRLRIASSLRAFDKNIHILRKAVKSQHKLLFIRQRFLSYVFNTAAWDLKNRQNKIFQSFLFLIVGFFLFPNRGIFRFFYKNKNLV